MEAIKKIDIYELLEVESTASVQEIKKAYRKKALKCHPDKNPDNPKAADQFRQLAKALEVLCDESARAAYDKLFRARKEAKERIKNLDSKRKKFKDDLEARERAARREQEIKEEEDERKLAEELDRIRKEGSRVVEEELNLIRRKLEEEILESKLKQNEIKLPRLKCKWSKKNEYDEVFLRSKFEQCGRISCLVVSKKGTSAIVEFEKTESAIKACELKRDNFQIEWVQGDPKENTFNDQYFKNFDSLSDSNKKREKIYFDEEYERKVLMKLNDAYLKQMNK